VTVTGTRREWLTEMSKHIRARRPRRVPTWFDRINRYRVAATFLFIPFVLALVPMVSPIDLDTIMPYLVRRSVYWFGLLILAIALAMDAWEVYAGKREVKRMIEARIRQDTDTDPTGK